MTDPDATRSDPPARQPCFTVGGRVATKHTVKVKKPLFRRKWLFLLPGTEWTVTAVELNENRAPVYTLRAGEYEIERREWQLKVLR